MKIFAAALPFLILATALGSQVEVVHEPMMAKIQHEPFIHTEGKGFHRPSDCCPDLKQRKIRCANMKDFFVTSSACSRPAVMSQEACVLIRILQGISFLTKKERLVCADPFDLQVQNCMRSLKMNHVDVRKRRLA
ncbi:C-C motif chemokine 15-like isoform X3 [Ailuropoda melanoleuca]|uniref:C-C motif chemokine 15-like isoform X3 n=1 Tax=Ailuropoda melanoleuca TaxID=9646 RepID=UPI000947FBEF|nr:C-C motif chemokine 15-like isoform X3 [Ailuropoda melanoleuca]